MTNGRQLSIKERNHLETYLNESKELIEIGEALNRDPRGIKYEIVQHRELFVRKNMSNKCGNQNNCNRRRLCDDCDTGLCKLCRHIICEIICDEFCELPNCKRINRFPGVCNGCESVKQCNLPKVYYRANTAQLEYEKNISEHKKGPKLDALEMKHINSVITEGV